MAKYRMECKMVQEYLNDEGGMNFLAKKDLKRDIK